MEQLFWRVAVFAAAMMLAGVECAAQSHESGNNVANVARLEVYNTSQVTMHTDLIPKDAQAALGEIEATLAFAARHWRRSDHGRINCYVASNVSNWPDTALPHPLARVWIGGVGGATVTEEPESRRSVRKKATVYASTLSGVLPHEIIHAYCLQTFGATGPEWYKEGIAEVVAYGLGQGKAVSCAPDVIVELRSSSRGLRQIVEAGEFTHDMRHSLGVMLASRRDAVSHVPLHHWTHRDMEQLERLRESYHWSWALCHFLLHNPNYSHRFRRLEESYLTGGRESFWHMFGPDLEELTFEFGQFTDHVGVGYRVDLCHWDWKKRFRGLERGEAATRCVRAKRGYQATGLTVEAGQTYRYQANGQWTTALGQSTDADGQTGGSGSLVAAILSPSGLTQAFQLGSGGAWRVPESGRLYTRCRDAWNELSDNGGSVHVRFERMR